MKSGPKKGSTRQGSLAAKMAQLSVGQWIIIQDKRGASDSPTLQERNVQTNLCRSPALEGFAIRTERVLVVNQDWTTTHALKISREA